MGGDVNNRRVRGAIPEAFRRRVRAGQDVVGRASEQLAGEPRLRFHAGGDLVGDTDDERGRGSFPERAATPQVRVETGARGRTDLVRLHEVSASVPQCVERHEVQRSVGNDRQPRAVRDVWPQRGEEALVEITQIAACFVESSFGETGRAGSRAFIRSVSLSEV